MSDCPNAEAILHYARERGLTDAALEYNVSFGWELTGSARDSFGKPLVWAIAVELGISRGCGGTGFAQIAPERF